MKRERISEILEKIAPEYIQEASEYTDGNSHAELSGDDANEKRTGTMTRFRRWGAIAACFALVALIGCTVFAVTTEAAEYRAAVEFFEENGLPADGLSRAEVKAVYRDITTGHFTYGKTAEVILKAVSGGEIDQREPTPQELAELWNKEFGYNEPPKTGIGFRYDSRRHYDAQRGRTVYDMYLIECYRDGNLLWTAEFPDFEPLDCTYSENGTLVWGRSDLYSSEVSTYAWIALVDNEGKILWKYAMEHDFRNEYIGAVLSNGDGTWTVFSRGDLRYLCVSRIDRNGKELSFCKTDVGNRGIGNVAHLKDGFLVQLCSSYPREFSTLYKLDRKGNILDVFAYEEEDCVYTVMDMIEYGGQIYLSAYAYPKVKRDGISETNELDRIIDDLFPGWENGETITSEELTPMVRGQYTAVLLICDPTGGMPETFYSVRGSLGGKLSVNTAGQLEWEVKSIASTYFSPMTNSFTIGGSCNVFRYTFLRTGELIGQTDTGEVASFRR